MNENLPADAAQLGFEALLKNAANSAMIPKTRLNR
jgi:hypothetical protein